MKLLEVEPGIPELDTCRIGIVTVRVLNRLWLST